MTQEEKQLLTKDLCSRLPYGVMCRMNGGGFETIEEDKLTAIGLFQFVEEGLECIPYLRPMLSMTVDEYNEFSDVANMTIYEDGKIITNGRDIDWLCKHHFDFRDLIGIGLALEAPEGMYNTKTE